MDAIIVVYPYRVITGNREYEQTKNPFDKNGKLHKQFSAKEAFFVKMYCVIFLWFMHLSATMIYKTLIFLKG